MLHYVVLCYAMYMYFVFIFLKVVVTVIIFNSCIIHL